MTQEQFRELVGISIGKASMCWSKIPEGEFDSTRAVELMEQIIKPYTDLENKIKMLEQSALLLGLLEEYGVDNWEGYGDAMKEYRKQIKENS